MKIAIAYPPIYEQACAVFPLKQRRDVIFAYGDTIYNPHDIRITKELVAHEEVHGARQTVLGVELWWEIYLKNKQFRYEEELPAHQAEYQAYCKRHQDGRRRMLRLIAEKLSSPLYGSMLTRADATTAILTQLTDSTQKIKSS